MSAPQQVQQGTEMESTNNLRSKLCHYANVSFEAWKDKADRGLARLIENLMSEAGTQEVGDAYLQFASETQAEYVRAHLTQEGLPTWLFTNEDDSIGIYIRWSERPGGEEIGTGKIAISVDEFWRFNRIEQSSAESALSMLDELEEAVRANRFLAANP